MDVITKEYGHLLTEAVEFRQDPQITDVMLVRLKNGAILGVNLNKREVIIESDCMEEKIENLSQLKSIA